MSSADKMTRPDYVHGLDVSGWQEPLDWRAVARAGYSYAWVKATEGQDHVSPRAATHALGVHERSSDNGAPGLLLGYYHFATPGTIRRDAEREARHFARLLRTLPPSTLRPVLDLESGKDVHTRETLSQWVLDWLDEATALLGVRPILYAGRYLRHLEPHVLTGSALWIPHYPALDVAPLSLARALRDRRLDKGQGPRRPAGAPWACWQWTSKGRIPGVEGRIDLNVAPSLSPLLWRPAASATVAA